MYSSLASPTALPVAEWTPEDHATWQSIGVQIRTALQSLETATATLTPLPAETQWASGGVAALHESLLDFRERAAMALSSQRQSEMDWNGVVVP